MTPQPLPPEQIKTPRGIGINEGEGGAKREEEKRPLRRTLRRFVARGGQLVEVESVVRETR